MMLVNVKFFYRQIINQDISLGTHDYYTISFLMDVVAFIIIVVGFSSFGVSLCVCVCMCVWVKFNRVCVSLCVCV